ncbi:MAG TPA: rhodanese-like domain-containing protein [Longimicrobiales bacterium]
MAVTPNGTLPPLVQPARIGQLLAEGAALRLLDVRTPAEFEAVHIRGAYNVPLDTLAEHREDLRRHVREPVVLVCRSGQRARQAEQALREIGMQNLHILDGGMNAWEAAELPVERGRPRLSLERQVRISAGALAATGGILALLVNPLFALVPALIGSGLVVAGVTDFCLMALLLGKLPYNRVAACDVNAMVAALKNGEAAPALAAARGSVRAAQGGPGGLAGPGACCA